MNNVISVKNLYDVWSSERECIKIIDFRPYGEFRLKHIPGAYSYRDPMDTLSEIECKGEILFVLIEPTQDFISKLGNVLAIDNTVTLEGGFASWQASQYPCAHMSL